MNVEILAIIGATGSGKSTMAKIATRLWTNAQMITTSDLIRQELEALSIEPNRLELANHSLRQRREICPEYWAQRALEEAISHGWSRLVVEGTRTPPSANFFIEHGALLVGIDAPIELRHQRVKERPDARETLTDDELWQNLKDDWYTSGPGGWDIPGSLALCHHQLDGSESVTLNSCRILDIMTQHGFQLNSEVAREIQHMCP